MGGGRSLGSGLGPAEGYSQVLDQGLSIVGVLGGIAALADNFNAAAAGVDGRDRLAVVVGELDGRGREQWGGVQGQVVFCLLLYW